MELAARQFARRVLLSHLALLILVLIVVAAAARYLYRSARVEVIQQAEQTQQLLARQTALGIDTYYESVTRVLNLLQPPETEGATQPTSQPFRRMQVGVRLNPNQRDTRRRNLDEGPFANMITRFGNAIWGNVKDKCSMLFVVDAIDAMRVVRVIGTSDPALNADDIATQSADWFTKVKTESISPFMPNIAGGAHLVCVPVRAAGGVFMVAVVPVSKLESTLLASVNRSESTGAMLVDEQGTFVSSSTPGVEGKKIDDLDDPRIRQLAKLHMEQGTGVTQTFDNPPRIAGVQLKPGMSTIEPVEVLGGKKWFVIISSNLNDVDDLVRPIFRDAMLWAVFVMIAVLAILISTSMQLIRSRLRLERAQIEIINKELAQARQIQLNWLPAQPCTIGGASIAAVNTPASHVSGDFYNWFELPDGRVTVTIGDVTGHGMSAAFLMATTQMLVRTSMPRCLDPGFCMEEVNRQLCTQMFHGQFVTMLILVIDFQNHYVDIAAAGHPPPLICEGNSVRRMPVETQLVLGIEKTTEFPTQRVPLSDGASLLLFTDGVADAQAPSGERFTNAGLDRALQGRCGSAQEMLETVTRSIDEFRLGRDLADDLTMVAVQLQSNAPASVLRREANAVL